MLLEGHLVSEVPVVGRLVSEVLSRRQKKKTLQAWALLPALTSAWETCHLTTDLVTCQPARFPPPPPPPNNDRLVGLVVKAPASIPVCDGIFPGRVIPVTYKLALQWLPCQAPGVITGRSVYATNIPRVLHPSDAVLHPSLTQSFTPV